MRILALLIFIFFPPLSFASMDLMLSYQKAEISVNYRIEPVLLDHCENVDCWSPTYQGIANISIQIDDVTGYLDSLVFLLNDEVADLGELSKLKSNEVQIYNLRLLVSPAYLPLMLREEIAGLGPPYFIIDGLGYINQACDYDVSEYRIIYYLEDETYRVDEACWEPR